MVLGGKTVLIVDTDCTEGSPANLDVERGLSYEI